MNDKLPKLRKSTMIKHPSIENSFKRFARFSLVTTKNNDNSLTHALQFQDYTPYFYEGKPNYDAFKHEIIFDENKPHAVWEIIERVVVWNGKHLAGSNNVISVLVMNK